ncbi:hypothetical protein [Streptomyces sp. NPDC058326]|uniref:hypothetical protein n=1 Tax=Streptomyces sp. NPDC058326 TaxID=3346447 RepID=UPI0036F09501
MAGEPGRYRRREREGYAVSVRHRPGGEYQALPATISRPRGQLLDSARYEAALPEETALLTGARLVRADDIEAAAERVRELRPHAHRLRWTGRPRHRARCTAAPSARSPPAAPIRRLI